MGNPTGFMDSPRQVNPAIAPLERIGNFGEFHSPLDRQARMRQGGRCMDCGVPFCQSGILLGGAVSGCPLHNLTPEWNDMLYRGNWSHALARLTKTNNFPEFTGRVCPALCEAACTCALNGEAVTIQENELAIIEDAFLHGLIVPAPPRTRTGRRVAVVGSGPSGLAAADQLNRRGHLVTVLEREDRPGGLLMYGIPNMKLDKAVVGRRVELMRGEGVTFLTGHDVGVQVDAQQLMADYDAVVLCCGAGKPRDLAVENRQVEGVHFAVDFLKETTRALLAGRESSITARDKAVVVVGGGDTGNDCVGTCIRQGCRSVVQLEMMPEPPTQRPADNPWPQWPRTRKTDYGQQEAIARFGGDPRRYQTTVSKLLGDPAGRLTGIQTQLLRPQADPDTGKVRMVPQEGSQDTLQADLLLIAAGFLGCQPYVPQAFGLDLTPRGTAATLPGRHATGIPGLFAAGDMRRGQSLVVWAISEGRSAAREVDQYLMGYSNLP